MILYISRVMIDFPVTNPYGAKSKSKMTSKREAGEAVSIARMARSSRPKRKVRDLHVATGENTSRKSPQLDNLEPENRLPILFLYLTVDCLGTLQLATVTSQTNPFPKRDAPPSQSESLFARARAKVSR